LIVTLDDHFDRRTRRVFDRVREQAADDLLEARLVPPALDGVRADTNATAVAASFVLEASHHAGHERSQINLFPLELEGSLRDLRYLEQRLDQAGQSLGLSQCQAQLATELFAGRLVRCFLGQPQQALDLEPERGEWRAQLVRGERNEVVARRERAA
jgi:hypothetical protein